MNGSASTARSSSLPFHVPLRREAMPRWKSNGSSRRFALVKRSIRMIRRWPMSSPTGEDAGTVGIRYHDDQRGGGAIRTTRASTGSCAQPFSTTFRSTCCAGQPGRGRGAHRPPPRHASSSTIWPSCSHETPGPAAALARSARCWTSPGAPTRSQGQRCLHLSREPYRSRTSGTPLAACSTPGVSNAACGVPTGLALRSRQLRTGGRAFRQTDA